MTCVKYLISFLPQAVNVLGQGRTWETYNERPHACMNNTERYTQCKTNLAKQVIYIEKHLKANKSVCYFSPFCIFSKFSIDYILFLKSRARKRGQFTKGNNGDIITLHTWEKIKSLKAAAHGWRAAGVGVNSSVYNPYQSQKRAVNLLWISRMHGLLTHILATEPLKQHWKKEKENPSKQILTNSKLNTSEL